MRKRCEFAIAKNYMVHWSENAAAVSAALLLLLLLLLFLVLCAGGSGGTGELALTHRYSCAVWLL